MDSIISDYKTAIQTTIEYTKEQLKGIRTGRANTGMIENLSVEAYGGTKMNLRDLASLTTEGPSTLAITPFDPSTVSDIEKAILSSELGFSPKTEGHTIYIRVPQLTEEQRLKYKRLVGQLTEEGKNTIRHERDEIRRKIKKMEDNKEISEDERYRLEKEIDNITSKETEHLQSLREKKEKEIMEV